MKIVCISILLFLFLCSFGFSLEMNPMKLSLTISYDLSVRGGFEYRFGRLFGFKSDAGIPLSLLSTGVGGLVYDVFGVIYLRDYQKPLQLNILLGIPNGSAALDADNIHMTAFGGSFMLRYGVDVKNSFSIRAGYGYPIFYKNGEVREYNTEDMKKGLDIAFGISWAVIPKVKKQPKPQDTEKKEK